LYLTGAERSISFIRFGLHGPVPRRFSLQVVTHKRMDVAQEAQRFAVKGLKGHSGVDMKKGAVQTEFAPLPGSFSVKYMLARTNLGLCSSGFMAASFSSRSTAFASCFLNL
jgi:hypothetical protein